MTENFCLTSTKSPEKKRFIVDMAGKTQSGSPPEVLFLPEDIVQSSPGFSFDVGKCSKYYSSLLYFFEVADPQGETSSSSKLS